MFKIIITFLVVYLIFMTAFEIFPRLTDQQLWSIWKNVLISMLCTAVTLATLFLIVAIF